MAVVITDVVLRDGLQDENVVVSTADKLAIVDALISAGITQIEAASFVSPTRVPQMADAPQLVAQLPHPPGVRFSALTLSANGVHRAAASGIDEIEVVASASTAHSRANAGRSPQQALRELAAAVAQHSAYTFIAGISTAFVCPFDGPVPPAQVVAVASAMAEMGVARIGLADTLGTASTDQVLQSVDAVRRALPDTELSLHLHNAHGQALDTVVAAATRLGITHFDSAAGGYGGCPFAPGAHGNIATEDLVAYLHAAGIDTGIDTDALAEAVALIKATLARGTPVTAA
jgi:hydroxymethylglutaryl-CoA lyase